MRIELSFFGSNARGQNVFDVRAGGDYIGQMVDRTHLGYRVFVGCRWHDFKTLHEAMEFWRQESRTPAPIARGERPRGMVAHAPTMAEQYVDDAIHALQKRKVPKKVLTISKKSF